LLISEIYSSLQGEGMLTGTPSVFVRASGCNLRCGFCDTPYTSWKPEGTELTLDEIVEQVKLHPARHVVVTGGEPMIAPDVVPLCERLHELGLHITIETAGTVSKPVACDLMSISPKLANSTPEGSWAITHNRLRIQQPVLADLMARYEYQLKFVVSRPEDMEEICSLVGVLGADGGRVILMPEGIDRERLHERSLWIAEICKQQGFRFSPRLHVDLYGNLRGV